MYLQYHIFSPNFLSLSINKCLSTWSLKQSCCLSYSERKGCVQDSSIAGRYVALGYTFKDHPLLRFGCIQRVI